jgi:amino acid transporter
VYKPGAFAIDAFFTYYFMLLLAPVTYLGWKFVKKTKLIKPEEADLIWEKPNIDAYEAMYEGEPTGFLKDVGNMFRFRRRKNQSNA